MPLPLAPRPGRRAGDGKDDLDPVPRAAAPGPRDEGRSAGVERLGPAGHRRGAQQDQDVRAEEGDAAPRAAQGRGAGRGRLDDVRGAAGPAPDHGGALGHHALRARLQRLLQGDRADPEPLRHRALRPPLGRGRAAAGGARVRGRGRAPAPEGPRGGRLHRRRGHAAGPEQPAGHLLRLRARVPRERLQGLRPAAPPPRGEHHQILPGARPGRREPGHDVARGDGLLRQRRDRHGLPDRPQLRHPGVPQARVPAGGGFLPDARRAGPRLAPPALRAARQALQAQGQGLGRPPARAIGGSNCFTRPDVAGGGSSYTDARDGTEWPGTEPRIISEERRRPAAVHAHGGEVYAPPPCERGGRQSRPCSRATSGGRGPSRTCGPWSARRAWCGCAAHRARARSA